MRFALRTLVPVFAAVVVAQSRPPFAVDLGLCSRCRRDMPPQAHAGSRCNAAAPTAEASTRKPLLDKGEAALKAGDYAAAWPLSTRPAKPPSKRATRRRRDIQSSAGRYVGRGRRTNGIEGIRSGRKRLPQHSSRRSQRRARPCRTGPIETGNGQAGRSARPISRRPSRQIQQTSKPSSATASRWSFSATATKPSRRSRASITADPKNAEAYRLRGTANAAMFKNKQAIEDVQKAIELNPDDYESYFTLGILHMRGEDYQGAVDQFGQGDRALQAEARPGRQPYLPRLPDAALPPTSSSARTRKIRPTKGRLSGIARRSRKN